MTIISVANRTILLSLHFQSNFNKPPTSRLSLSVSPLSVPVEPTYWLVCVWAGQLAALCSARLGSLLASNGAAGWPALLSVSPRGGFVAARERTALRRLLSESLPVFPNHREMYAPKLGNRTGCFSPDYHSVSSFFFSPLNLTGTSPLLGLTAQQWKECLKASVLFLLKLQWLILLSAELLKQTFEFEVTGLCWNLKQRLEDITDVVVLQSFFQCLSQSSGTCQWVQLLALGVNGFLHSWWSQPQAMWRG